MNQYIETLADKCEEWNTVGDKCELNLVLYTEAIIQECIDNLAWHGHDDAVSQLEYLKIQRFGIK